ncbi:hypothetical protein [Natrinema halophilum]|uniref:DUF998 domain-containing protein n=1 Tax=Natrinema halophilum TaxID=1699371 RepID=A0A7D5GK89_9EURY|nr:hypothetical protein [Natrinema halophilum]QLG51067.1 hypothetical protein HYG82_20650 [Natrinema halophilum]
MGRDIRRQWKVLERWCPMVFLFAGTLLVGYATFNGIHAFTGIEYESAENVFGPGGFALGFLGLLGLYPALRDRSPKLARVGAICAVLGAVAFSVFVVANLGEIAGLISPDPPAWAVVFLAMAAIGMISGYLTFAVAVVRSDVHSRMLGLLLLVPLAIFATMLTTSRVGFFPQELAFAISSGQALAYLAIGYILRTGRTRTEREIPSNDVIVS